MQKKRLLQQEAFSIKIFIELFEAIPLWMRFSMDSAEKGKRESISAKTRALV